MPMIISCDNGSNGNDNGDNHWDDALLLHYPGGICRTRLHPPKCDAAILR